MAELADALDLGSSGETRQGSNPCTPTKVPVGKPVRVQIPVRPPKFTKENRRHEVERERSAAVKLADALDLGATGKPVRVQIPVPAPNLKLADALDLGATGKPVRVQIPVRPPKFTTENRRHRKPATRTINIPDNRADNSDLVCPSLISRHMPRSPKIKSAKIPKIFFS